MLSIIINILIKFNKKNLQDNRLRENFGDFGDFFFMLNETSSMLECQ